MDTISATLPLAQLKIFFFLPCSCNKLWTLIYLISFSFIPICALWNYVRDWKNTYSRLPMSSTAMECLLSISTTNVVVTAVLLYYFHLMKTVTIPVIFQVNSFDFFSYPCITNAYLSINLLINRYNKTTTDSATHHLVHMAKQLLKNSNQLWELNLVIVDIKL